MVHRLTLLGDIMLVSFELSHDVIKFLARMMEVGAIPVQHQREVAAKIQEAMIKGRSIMAAFDALNKK